MSREYDAVIIGSGQGGTPLAFSLAQKGEKTALIEREHLGGTCVNEGCTPTKTMVASARIAHLAGRAADYGVPASTAGRERGGRTGNPVIDFKTVRKRKRDIVDSFRSGSEQAVKEAENLTWFEGEARFNGEKQLEVIGKDGSAEELRAARVFIDTGTSPLIPPIPGLEGVPYLTSTTIMELEEVPEHLIVIGGGYIGLEFSQMFSRFGSKVTIINRGSQLASREDPDIAGKIQEIFEEEGITVMLESVTTSVKKTFDGSMACTVEQDGKEVECSGSHILVATGRKPNTGGLNLDATGVKTDSRGFIVVNNRLETNHPEIWAIGDVTGGPMFTHRSYDDFRIIHTNLYGEGEASTAGRLIPYTMFIDPQLGRVGISEKEAQETGRNIKVATMPMTHVARALEVDETRGMMKAIVDADTDKILGFACLSIEGGEVMGAVQIAMMGGLPYQALREGLFAHPTLVESLNNLFATI
jgi:pyruvate/2-oxoglutarate dehydrogenase complex dihydrolipoamide dehydrogenase (E3) component